MSALTELDVSYLKSINALHSKDHLHGGKPTLQALLEDAIKSKTGKDMNLTAMVQTLMKQSGVETPLSIDEMKAVSTSDNELELDLLLKEDLACVICQGMDVGARNRLLECSDCHALYHQECHQPAVTQHEADNAWLCALCKEAKRSRKSPTHSSSSTSHSSAKPKSTPNSPRHSSDRSERGDRSSSSGYKSSSSSSSKSGSKSSSSGSTSKSSSSSSSKSSSSKVTPVTTSSSIVSADKRIQNMKKKAAKLHEKKKLPR